MITEIVQDIKTSIHFYWKYAASHDPRAFSLGHMLWWSLAWRLKWSSTEGLWVFRIAIKYVLWEVYKTAILSISKHRVTKIICYNCLPPSEGSPQNIHILTVCSLLWSERRNAPHGNMSHKRYLHVVLYSATGS